MWNGNSDNTPVSTPARPVFSIDVSTFVWQGFLQEATEKWEITRFSRPDEGLTQVAIDPFTGMLPLRADRGRRRVVPGRHRADDRGCRRARCGIEALEATRHEPKFPNWMDADRDWLRRAQRGVGVAGGPDRTRTAYFYNGQFSPYGRTWGPFVTRNNCGASPSPTPSCIPLPTPDENGVIPSFEIPSPSGSEVAAVPVPAGIGGAEPERGGDADPGAHLGTDAGADTRADAGADARAHAGADRAAGRTLLTRHAIVIG